MAAGQALSPDSCFDARQDVVCRIPSEVLNAQDEEVKNTEKLETAILHCESSAISAFRA